MNQRGSLLIYGILALAILSALSGIAYKIYSAGEASMKAEWDKAVREQSEKEVAQGNAAATKLEDGNAKAKTVYKTITRSVDKYIDRPIYRAECFDFDGVRDSNAALSGKAAPPGELDKPVPRSDPAK